MKTAQYTLTLENFQEWYRTAHKQHAGILGAEYDKGKLKIFYKDTATPLTQEQLDQVKIPTVLKFRKKVTPPDLGVADTTVKATSENEFTVETQQPEEVRKKVKENYKDFEEIQ